MKSDEEIERCLIAIIEHNILLKESRDKEFPIMEKWFDTQEDRMKQYLVDQYCPKHFTVKNLTAPNKRQLYRKHQITNGYSRSTRYAYENEMREKYDTSKYKSFSNNRMYIFSLDLVLNTYKQYTQFNIPYYSIFENDYIDKSKDVRLYYIQIPIYINKNNINLVQKYSGKIVILAKNEKFGYPIFTNAESTYNFIRDCIPFIDSSFNPEIENNIETREEVIKCLNFLINTSDEELMEHNLKSWAYGLTLIPNKTN